MKNERGAVMVEAVIIFPMVLFTVFFLIYFSLFKLQETAFTYQVQRAAHQGALLLASPGYQHLGDYQTKKIDFTETLSTETAPDVVNAYYQSYHEGIGVIYREIFGYSSFISKDEVQGFMDRVKEDTLILAGFSVFENKVEIKRGLFSTNIEATVEFGLPTPFVLRYLGFDGELRFKEGASANAISPSSVVRTVDLAGDIAVVVTEKLGIKDDLDKIMDGIKKYLF